MGIKLINEIMDFAPRMTATEWKAMIILAEDANDGTRQTWSAVTGEKIMRRMDLTSAAATNLRGVLVRKGLLEVAVAAKRGRAAKYRFPDFRSMGHEIHEASEPLGHESHDETDASAPAESPLGHEIHDETGPMGHETHEATGEWVMGSVTPTPQEHSSRATPQNLSRAQRLTTVEPTGGRETVQGESEPQREEPQARPQEQRPAKQPHLDDVADAYAKARADIGKPATRMERIHIRGGAVELIREGQTIEYLIRLADWMGREHPGWTDLPRARTAPGSPPLIPGQRDPGQRSESGGHQTWRDPDPSGYYNPKQGRRESFQNPTEPGAYEGSF